MKRNSLFLLAIFVIFFFITLLGVKYFYMKKKVTRLTRCKDYMSHVALPVLRPKGMRVILLGDSRIQQWEAPVFGKQIETINLGISGATSNELLCYITEKIGQIRADWFILQVGINDIVTASMQSQDMRNTTINNLLANLKKIVTQLKGNGGSVIVLTLVPPISPGIIRTLLWGGGIDEAVEQVSGEIVDELGQDVLVYDMKQIFFDREHSRWKKQYTTDALHWSQEGYEHLTHEMRNLFVRSMQDEKNIESMSERPMNVK